MKAFRLFIGLWILSLPIAMADEAIQKVQTELQRAGLYDGSVDGVMGSRTSAAIRRYQIQSRLKVTGALNSQTLIHLGISPAGQKTSLPPTEIEIQLGELFSGGPYSTAPYARQQTLLEQAQRRLIERGFFSGAPDGQPGKAFSQALRSWQQSIPLKATGRMDSATCEKLRLR